MKKRLPEAPRATSVLFLVLLFLLFAGQPLHAAAIEENGTYADFDGLRVHYVDEGPRERPALVFIHGWSCDVSFWRFQTEALREKFRVIAIDLPGFGLSDKPADRAYTLDLFAGATRAVVEAAGVENPVLIGDSMGYPVTTK